MYDTIATIYEYGTMILGNQCGLYSPWEALLAVLL